MSDAKRGYGRLSKTLLGRQIESGLKGAKTVFVTQFSSVSSNALNDLRKNLRKNKARYMIVKNAVGRRVLEGTPQKPLAPLVGGQCGLAITNEDAARVSKVFASFADENAGFKIGGAFVEGQVFTADMVKRLASLPSREELIAKALGGLLSPMTGLVSVLGQLVTAFVNVLDQIRKSKEQGKGSGE